MYPLLRIELFKIFHRPRTYIAFVVIAVIILLIQIALKYGGIEYVQLIINSGLGETFEIPSTQILNGYFICFLILNLLLIHVPILVALVAGDVIAGEANMGTLRLLASKPIGRTKLLLVKFMATSVYTLLLLIWVAIMALLVSVLLFGTDSLIVAREFEFNIIAENDVLWRFGAAFVFAAAGLICVAALAFMLSAFSTNSIGPIVATVCVIIILTILTQLQIPFYDETIKPFLFTTHMLGWKGFFYVNGQNGETIRGSIEQIGTIVKSFAVLLGYIFLFVSIAVIHFKRKSILS